MYAFTYKCKIYENFNSIPLLVISNLPCSSAIDEANTPVPSLNNFCDLIVVLKSRKTTCILPLLSCALMSANGLVKPFVTKENSEGFEWE